MLMEHSLEYRIPTIRYWDLRYFDTHTAKTLSDLPNPDLIAVNGVHAWQMLNNASYP